MEDDDEIDAMLEQVFGKLWRAAAAFCARARA
jgi:hypothetical protein